MTGGGVPPVIVMPQLMLDSASAWLDKKILTSARHRAKFFKEFFKRRPSE
jgi:hypothetical protein